MKIRTGSDPPLDFGLLFIMIARYLADFSKRSIHTQVGPDMDRLGKMAGSQAIMIKSSPKSEGGSEPVRLHFSCEDNKKSFQKVEILAKEGEEVNVLMDYTSPEKTSSGLAAIQTKLHIEKGAKVRLVQVQLLGNEYTLLNDIGAQCEDGAQFEVLQLFLGSSKTYSGCQADLLGKESHFKADIGYQGKGSQRYDMNYVAVHKGKKTVSEMNADGILDDQAFKLFRGTIDFKNGSSRLQGRRKGRRTPYVLCNTGTIVFHDQTGKVLFHAGQPDAYHSSVTAIFRSVGQQVIQYLIQLIRIKISIERFRRTRNTKLHILLFHQRSETVETTPYELRQVSLRHS